ncbi:MAG: hypothetical protein H8E81_08420 [Deltaproteobacteria bacterium]|nr:hypothetical protein [Deltaproteobacteria bacterium]
MRLTNFNLTTTDNRTRVSASVTWEDCDQPRQTVFIETESRFSDDISCNPNAFLVGCLLPAMHYGEKRIRVEGDICPLLNEGLQTVMGIMQHWSGGTYRPLVIEAKPADHIPYLTRKRHTALFMSGGIDSLAAFRLNRMNFSSSHPGRIADCLLVHGFDIGGVVERGGKFRVFDRARAALSYLVKDAGVNLIPAYTNIRHLCDNRNLWLDKFFGAVLAAVAHTFSPRLSVGLIASSYDISHLHPCGSHPLLDPAYSSYNLRIVHRDLALSRMEKLEIVASWEEAFQNLRVCLANVPDRLNCGRCEKCVRTMLELLSIDQLSNTRAFEENDVSPDRLSAFSIRIRDREPFYQELLPLLKERGRYDLVATIEDKLKNDPTS